VIVEVALGEPGVPVICWAETEVAVMAPTRKDSDMAIQLFCI
jgi:hypothetical protein